MQNKKLILLLLLMSIPFTLLQSKQDSIKLSLEYITVGMDNDSTAVGIYFFIGLENISNDDLAFGSFNEEKIYNSMDVGYFLLIHKTDTIKLLTRGIPFSYYSRNEETVFISYIKKDNKNKKIKNVFKNIPKVGYREYLHNFFLECKIVYVPIIKNYKLTTKNNKIMKNFYFLENPVMIQYPEHLDIWFLEDSPLIMEF